MAIRNKGREKKRRKVKIKTIRTKGKCCKTKQRV
jgi:hypothetical protein